MIVTRNKKLNTLVIERTAGYINDKKEWLYDESVLGSNKSYPPLYIENPDVVIDHIIEWPLMALTASQINDIRESGSTHASREN